MPTSLQYPLERSRGLQLKWGRLLQQWPSRDGPISVISTIPPRDPDDDDNDDDEEEEDVEVDREPAVIIVPLS
jgi:hypothetical protein